MGESTGDIVAISGNPYSGSKQNRVMVEALMHALTERKFEPIAVWEKGELAERSHDPEFVERCRCVVAAGGDGTLLHVVNMETNLPVLHYPLGNENLFAGHWRVSADPDAVATMIERGHTTTIDLGRAVHTDASGGGTSELFTCVASAGFDAEVVHRLDRWRNRKTNYRRVKRTSYARPILAAATGYRYPRMTVTPSEGAALTGTAVFVFNLPRYGMGLHICPTAEPDDGLLDYVVFEKPGAWSLLKLSIAIKQGRHTQRDDVHVGRAKSIRIEGDAPVPLELDGDPGGTTPVTLECVPGIQRVVVGE